MTAVNFRIISRWQLQLTILCRRRADQALQPQWESQLCEISDQSLMEPMLSAHRAGMFEAAVGLASGIALMPDVRSLSKIKKRSLAMTNLITLAVGAAIAIGTIATPTAADARWRHHHRFPGRSHCRRLGAGAILGAATLLRLRV